jgi:cysteine desulfurase
VIYLDHAATTPIDPEVREAMIPFIFEHFGNPSSIHRVGQEARRAIDTARDALATALGAEPGEIYFTSGGTEACNLALLGALLSARQSSGRDGLIVSAIEHHAVLDTAHFAQTLGFTVTVLPVDELGRVAPEALAEALTDRTALVSIMDANNEIGTLQPISALAALAHSRGALFHTDAVQTLGVLTIDVDRLGVDLLSASAHKIYGPKGVGALYARRGVKLTPWLHGGTQEREKRAGTENVAGIVGFGKAAELLPTWRDKTSARLAPLRDDFWTELQNKIPGAVLNGPPPGPERLPGNLNVCFPGTDAETLLLALDFRGVAASAGSACASGSLEPSHVLIALGRSLTQARASVRFSLGRHTTDTELSQTLEILGELTR